jgi:uncharacterized membrane protein SirB2
MSFLLLKTIHVSCAIASFTLFFLRGIWSMNNSPIMRQRWIKIVPHVVDTLLLASALAMAFTIHQYPFVDAWLTAKVIGLLLYIGLGSVALKYGKSKAIRFSAWLAAQLVFAYIVLVAISHNPLPFITTPFIH